MAQCKHAFHKHNDVSVHCRVLETAGVPYTHCPNQRFCAAKHAWVCNVMTGGCEIAKNPPVLEAPKPAPKTKKASAKKEKAENK